MTTDPLTDRMRYFQAQGDPAFPAGFPVVARLVESGLGANLKAEVLRTSACACLVHQFGASAGYAFGDEITLVWNELPGMSAGRLASALSSAATGFVAVELPTSAPELVGKLPAWSGYAHYLPSRYEAANFIVWRERHIPKGTRALLYRRVVEAPAFFHEELRQAATAAVSRVVIRKSEGVVFATMKNREEVLFEGAEPK